ncbi:MAG: hypothetical protein NVS4B11_09050 [Ktedonobacteraceae bacterium]
MSRTPIVHVVRIALALFICACALSQMTYAHSYVQASSSQQTVHRLTQATSPTVLPPVLQLDQRIPVQTIEGQSHFTNINAKFGSRFNFSINPATSSVSSGTDGIFHDNIASYIVGIAPSDQHKTFIFHMGTPNTTQGDTYLRNEQWTQGLDTTRWEGDATDGTGMHVAVDFIDTFRGEPGCIALAQCAHAVRDDIVPVLLVGVQLQNRSSTALTGNFLFGSNRVLPVNNACIPHTTPDGTSVSLLSYGTTADTSGGTLFLAGDQHHWACNTSVSDRAGLAWAYSVPAGQSSTAYLILGGWNPSQQLFANTTLPAGCQNEGLYAAHEWSSEQAVVDFAIDNLSMHDNLLAQAQTMENYLINNNVLTPSQRWLLGNTLRSYKASSWLVARQACAGGGYDATVYEGTYGFLSTIDVMHEYGYFEITRVPWFFKSALEMVFKNATHNAFGTYFQHDQGGDVDGNGQCTAPGHGIPTIRTTCYAPPYIATGIPMPTEENDNVTLLLAYYEFITGDSDLLNRTIGLVDAAMMHNLKVGDPTTGIAYNSQDTNTTFDAASDCLHNSGVGAGNQYYQGLKEATGYRAAAYLDGLVRGNTNGPTWQDAAAKIEGAMVQKYATYGFLPIANNNAFSNCSGRTVMIGEGLFYLHLIGQDSTMNQTLLHDLAQQYLSDLGADTLSSPNMVALTSTAAHGEQCQTGHCLRYEWFSKVMLSGIVADLVYTKNGCPSCARLDIVEAAYTYNVDFAKTFSDGFHDDNSDWGGHFYPRGIISWAYLSVMY